MENLTWHDHAVVKEDREKLLGQRGCVIWLTGLSGSGKSSIANGAAKKLHDSGALCYVLDGDNVRKGLNSNLGFSADDRTENIRRVGEVATLFADAGIVTFVSFISPYRSDRDAVRKKVGDGFVEVFVNCGLEEAERRDPKGFYKKARAGEISDFTGISAPYEEPKNPELILDSENDPLDVNAKKVVEFLKEKSFF